MPTAAVGNPNFCDFANRNDPPATQTHQAIAKLREIRKASLGIDFPGVSDITLNHRGRDMKSEEFFLGGKVYFSREMAKIKRVSDGKFRVSL